MAELTQVEARQAGAVFEHVLHVFHIFRNETAQVEALQARAARKHVTHVGHILGIEMAQVNALQAGTIFKHVSHIGHFIRIEIRKSIEGFERTETGEPMTAIRGVVFGERRVKIDSASERATPSTCPATSRSVLPG